MDKKLSKRQINALKKSIKHWEICFNNALPVFRGYDECDLCKLYANNRCISCPVKIATGVADCHGTPWSMKRKSLKQDKEELAFLKSLLPKE